MCNMQINYHIGRTIRHISHPSFIPAEKRITCTQIYVYGIDEHGIRLIILARFGHNFIGMLQLPCLAPAMVCVH